MQMDFKTQRFSIYQIVFFFIWWTSILISGFSYWKELSSSWPYKVCTTNLIHDLAMTVIQPRYWFGLFTIALTAFGLSLAFKKGTANPKVFDMRWPIVAAVILTLLLLPLINCR